MPQNRPEEYPFDHLVIIGRDKLSSLSQKFKTQGFQLTPIAHHNLGSCNQLIMLDSAYIELLGWEPGKPPQRAEIANQPLGLDALVFRTANAQKTYEQLLAAGFAVNPVQDLSREAKFSDKVVLVQFKTVRFSKQPIDGIRIYFCEHLTPEYVWQDQWLAHQNHMDHLEQIVLASQNAEDVAITLTRLLHLDESHISRTERSISLTLPNLLMTIRQDRNILNTKIESVRLIEIKPNPLDFILNADFFNHIT